MTQTVSADGAYRGPMTRALALAVALVVAALVGAGDGAAVQEQNPKLFGTVGPGFNISLRDAQGNQVTKLDPGTYVIEVEDLSDLHTFHLSGPGVDERTQVEFMGKVTWTVTFSDGTYLYRCDVHPTEMRGTFASGNAPAPTPTPTPKPQPPPPGVTAKTRLQLTSGPGEVITLKTRAGKAFKTMKVGTYTMVVRDRSRAHNAHVVAPGFNKKTTVPYTGSQTWKVALKRAGTLRFLCDVHASVGMKGSAKIVK